MIELIPLMREAVKKGRERDFETIEHDDAHIQKELSFLNDGLELLQKKWTMDLIYIIRIKGKPFFNDLVSYIISSPIIAAVFEGTDAVALARSTMGATKPLEAAMGTIRGDYGMEIGRNLVHGSDSVDNAQKEINLFFTPDEIVTWSRDVDRWIIES